ncbi:MAG: hypothetical protein ABIK73_06680 [candidate division WOR-3 bacterium]
MMQERDNLVVLQRRVLMRLQRARARRMGELIKKVSGMFMQVMLEEKRRVKAALENTKFDVYGFYLTESVEGVGEAGRINGKAVGTIGITGAVLMVSQRIPQEILDELERQIDVEAYKRFLRECYVDASRLANLELEAHLSYILGFNVRHRMAEEWVEKNAEKYFRRYMPKMLKSKMQALRGILYDGLRRGEDIFEIIKRAEAFYDDLASRKAEVWARTEVNRAYSYSLVEGYRDVGVKKKYWIGSGSPYYLQDVCLENELMGEIDIDGSFKDIDGADIDAPPAHPNCLCSVGIGIDEDWEPKNLFLDVGA